MNVLQELNRELAGILGQRRNAEAKIKRQEAARSAGGMKQARALAGEHGIEIEKDAQGGWWVTHPKLTGEADPLDGANFCTDGREVFDAVRCYADHLANT